MTDRELMQQALEALEIESKGYADKVTRNRGIITALRERLAQPEQEPVAWWHDMGGVVDLNVSGHGRPLYFAPPRREWVGLTEEDVVELWNQKVWNEGQLSEAVRFYARAIEAKLKEKNNG